MNAGYTAGVMKSFSTACVIAVSVLASGAQPPRPAAAANAQALTIEQLIDIRHPSNAAWSPDGRRVAFLSDRAGIANILVASIDASGKPGAAQPITRFADGLNAGLFWS